MAGGVPRKVRRVETGMIEMETPRGGLQYNTLFSRCLRYRPRGVVQVRGVSRTPIVSTDRGNSCDKMRTTQVGKLHCVV